MAQRDGKRRDGAAEWLKSILVAFVLVGSFRSAIADWNDVPTGSMKPTILEGDRIFVNRLAYDLKVPFTSLSLARLGEPGRGDIVVFPSPVDGTRLVKRIVGVPGDTIALRDGVLIVNGRPEHYERARAPLAPASRDFGPLTVPPASFFMMGDNRDDSYDSRYWGFVARDAIRGRATRVALSVDPSRHYLPRLERFGRPLD